LLLSHKHHCNPIISNMDNDIAQRSQSLFNRNQQAKRRITISDHPLQYIQEGDYAQITKVFTDEDVHNFAQLVGDYNPVHFDEEYIGKNMDNIFSGRVVHGILVGALISTVAGTILPGPGSVYLSQNFEFKKPAYLNEELLAHVQCIKALNKKRNVFLFDTIVTNKKTGEILISGEARVYHPRIVLQNFA